jgi:hypothetical protein
MKKHSHEKYLLFVATALVFALALHSQLVLGQEITGSILGTVMDSTGAVVAGATVTVTNEQTGVSAEATTDNLGNFAFPRLLPGIYAIKVERPGFRSLVRKGVTVSVAVASRADLTLEVGAVTETVTVLADVKQVEATSTQLSAALSGDAIVRLPLINRDWITLARTLPGVTASSDRFGLPSINGGRTQSNNYLINGIDYNDLPLNTPQTPPSPDSIAEFRIITSSMNPEYSRNSAGTLNAITRSGTNAIHGSAFWFHRDHGLNANEFFINKAGKRKPDFIRQQYGGTVGGPAYKDHTFWFISYQGLRSGVPQDNGLQRVPSADERNGIITRSSALSTSPIPFPVTGSPSSTVCPNTTCPAGTPWRNAFPVTGGVVTIPTSNFNPVSVNILKFYPIPAAGTNSFAAVGRQVSEDAQFSARGDQNWKKDKVFGYFFWRDSTRTRPFSFTGGNVPGFGDAAKSFNRQISISHIHTFASTAVNEFRIGYNRLRFLAVFPVNVIQPSALGFTNINPQHPDVASAPRVSISGFARFGFSNNGPQPRTDATFQYAENFSWIWRRHSFKFGIDNRRGKIINPFDFGNNGVFSFSGTTPAPFNSGSALINFLLGIPTSYSQNTGALNAAKSEEYYSYVQDTWQVLSNLTIVYGLGYQVDTPYRQLDNFGVAQIAFRPGRFSTVYPTAPPGILYTGDPGILRGTVPTRVDNFGPRFGIAWSPSSEHGPLHWLTGGKGNFSIRAGFGIFYNIIEGEASLQFLGNPPLGLASNGVKDAPIPSGFASVGTPSFADPWRTVNSIPIGTVATVTIPNKFRAATAPPIGSTTFDFSPFFPFSINILDPKLKVPRSYNFHLTIERQVKTDLFVRVGYVGSLGRNLYNTSEANPVDTVRCATIPACVDSSPFTQLSGVPGITPFNGAIYGSLGLQQSIATSSYHSLQLSAEKRMSHGLFLRGNYTFSKSLDNSSGLEDSGLFNGMTPGNPKRDKSFSGFDTRHNATISATWELPLPKPSNPFLRHVFQKWSVSTVAAFESGFPVTINDSSDGCLAGNGLLFYGTWCRPDLVGPIKILDPRATKNNLGFDTSAFAFSALGQIGTSARNLFHGPGLNNWDIGILKDTYITESKYIQFRAEFSNAFNHAQFNNPGFNTDADDISSTIFGQVRSTRSFGEGLNGSRKIQLALKFIF